MNKKNMQDAMSLISNINNELLVLSFELDSSSHPLVKEALENISKNISQLREAIKKEDK